jgi:50S ribosomal protein L16 3-hydroxylase
MLAEWLAPMPIAEFEASVLHASAFARAGAARAAVPLLGWDTLDRVLAARPAPDALVVARGEVLEVPVPGSTAELRPLLNRGLGINVRHAERYDARLRALADEFERSLDGRVQVQLFATPAATHSFGWHYDAEDVFIAQTLGAKDYYFRKNTVDTLAQRQPDFSRVRAETSALQTARLLAGDWLYIPRRWWHIAKCLEESLSISVGVARSRPE